MLNKAVENKLVQLELLHIIPKHNLFLVLLFLKDKRKQPFDRLMGYLKNNNTRAAEFHRQTELHCF